MRANKALLVNSVVASGNTTCEAPASDACEGRIVRRNGAPASPPGSVCAVAMQNVAQSIRAVDGNNRWSNMAGGKAMLAKDYREISTFLVMRWSPASSTTKYGPLGKPAVLNVKVYSPLVTVLTPLVSINFPMML